MPAFFERLLRDFFDNLIGLVWYGNMASRSTVELLVQEEGGRP